MARKTYVKKIKNGHEYYFYRLRHDNLEKPLDLLAKTVKELDQKIKEKTKELDNGIKNNKECFGVFFTEWLFNVHFIGKKPSTKERYEGIYRNYIKNSSIYNIKIKDLKPRDIQYYYNNLIKSGKRTGIVESLHKLIAPCVRYAYDSDIIIKDYTRAIKIPTESEDIKLSRKRKITPFTLEEQWKFVNAIKGHELEALFFTALNTGLRQGELLALTWDDVNLDKGSVSVNKTVKSVAEVNESGRYKAEIMIQTPKSKKGKRDVKIPKRLIILFKQHKKKQLENKIGLAGGYYDNNLVFSNSYGKHLDASNVRKKFKKLLKDNNIREIAFHDLRHTYATRLFELDEKPKVVQEFMGHSNLAMTLDTYSHVLDPLKEQVGNKLDLLYDSEEYKSLSGS